MHAWATGIEQVAKIAPEQVPVKVVWFLAILAVDDQSANAPWPQQHLEDLKLAEVVHQILALLLGQFIELVAVEGAEVGGRILRIAVERVERLIVHPLTVVPPSIPWGVDLRPSVG